MTILRKIVLIINLLAAVALIAGSLSIYLNPSQWWFISFFGLMYPLFLVINLFFLFLWIIVRLKYVVLPVTAILLTFPVLKSYVAVPFTRGTKTDAPGIKIMSYNVRNFDVYHWTKEKNAMQEIVDLIKKEKPGIACIQEFYTTDNGRYQTIKFLHQAGFPYVVFEKKFTGKNGRYWGTAIFSRYPIVGNGRVQFDNITQNSCSYADIKIDSTILRVFNIHLQSIYLSKQDYQYLADISQNQDVQVAPTRAIASKLKRAFILRGEQALDIEKEIRKSKYPVIVCGDFNDTPASFAYHTLSKRINDAFLQAGSGFGGTYSGFLQSYRIDYIFTSDKLTVKNFRTINAPYSDHYPITCEAVMKK